MLEFFKFACSNFWIFVGTVILLSVIIYGVVDSLRAIASIFRRRR